MNKDVSHWPIPLRLIHWLSAVLVLMALGYGVYMVQLVHDTGMRFELTQTHKSIGVAVLALTVIRLCIRFVATIPKPELTARFLIFAAKSAHIGLYLLLLGMPLSGWLMATTTPVRIPTIVFGLFQLPYPLPPDPATYRLAHGIHVAFAIVLASLVGVHVIAALIHALWWRDRTLVRMWRINRSAV
jgi:cytochrome b561